MGVATRFKAMSTTTLRADPTTRAATARPRVPLGRKMSAAGMTRAATPQRFMRAPQKLPETKAWMMTEMSPITKPGMGP